MIGNVKVSVTLRLVRHKMAMLTHWLACQFSLFLSDHVTTLSALLPLALRAESQNADSLQLVVGWKMCLPTWLLISQRHSLTMRNQLAPSKAANSITGYLGNKEKEYRKHSGLLVSTYTLQHWGPGCTKILHGICMFSLCKLRFHVGTLVSVHISRTCNLNLASV